MIRLNKFDGLTCLQLIQISQLVYYQNLVIYLLIYNEEIEETKISQLRKRWQMDEMSKIQDTKTKMGDFRLLPDA